MLELIAIGAGAVLLAAVRDIVSDGMPWHPRLAETLAARRGKRVDVIETGRDGRISKRALDDWLRDNAGTTKIKPEDREFLEAQLKLINEGAGR